MAAYDPKRPRPAQLAEDAAPVDALLEPSTPPVEPVPAAASADAAAPTPTGPRSGEVPVAPAPEVGTTNRAVLYASLGVAAVVAAVLVVLRVRSRRAEGGLTAG